MPTLAAPLDCAKLETRNERIHQLSTAPSTPVTGQIYYNTTDNTTYWWNGTAWRSADASSGVGGPPTGAAGGDLSGTYPNPQILANTIVLGDCNASMTDQAVGTGSLRTLGFGAQQALAGTTRLDQIAIPTAAVQMNSQKLSGVLNPTGAQDAATKGYVDATVQGLDIKASCRVASTGNIVTTAPGTTIDGVTMVALDRVLLKNQTTASQNGIWVFQTSATAMARASDADISAEVTTGMYTFIEEGTVNASSGWSLTTVMPITLDTTSLTFVQFSGAGQITAGNGLTKTGNTIDAVGTAARISVASDSIDIDSTYVGQTSITTLGTINTGSWNATTIPIAKGGTGATTDVLAAQALKVARVYSSATHGAGLTISIPYTTHLCGGGGGGGRAITVQCMIDATGVVILPDITVASNSDVTVTFAVSQSANTIRTNIIG